MKIGPGVSELSRVENRPLPLTWPMAWTTACTTVQAVIILVLFSGSESDIPFLIEPLTYLLVLTTSSTGQWLIVHESYYNCTLLISQSASASGCRSCQTLALSSFIKFVIHHLGTLSIVKTWVRLRYESVSNVWFMLCYVTVMHCNY